MTLEAALRDMSRGLVGLQDELSSLQITIRQDRPSASALEDTYGDAIDDLLGWLEEALVAADSGKQAVDQKIDMDRVWRALATCQAHFLRIEYGLFNLLSYDSLVTLVQFSRQSGPEWKSWIEIVKIGLDRSLELVYESSQMLLQCWQEIAERAATGSVSVQNTAIGQQITASERDLAPPNGFP